MLVLKMLTIIINREITRKHLLLHCLIITPFGAGRKGEEIGPT